MAPNAAWIVSVALLDSPEIWTFVMNTGLSMYWISGFSFPLLPGRRTTTSIDAIFVPGDRSWDSCAVYLSTGLTNWNCSNFPFPAPAPVDALPIVVGFVASSVNDDSSNALFLLGV